MSLFSNSRFVGASHGSRLASFAIVGAVALGLSACSGGGGSSGGDPGARPLPSGMSCQSLRADLNKMDSQGAQSKVEAASQGKASPEAKAVADRYNTLLNHYLGARCHV
jgi:hypothetical protein